MLILTFPTSFVTTAGGLAGQGERTPVLLRQLVRYPSGMTKETWKLWINYIITEQQRLYQYQLFR